MRAAIYARYSTDLQRTATTDRRRPGRGLWRDGTWDIELVGEIANMVTLSTDNGGSRSEEFRRSVKVVAGEGLEPPTRGL